MTALLREPITKSKRRRELAHSQYKNGAGLDSNNCAARGYVAVCRMEETVPLLKKQSDTETANTGNGDLNVAAPISGCEASLQTSLQTTDVDELQSLLDKAQMLLNSQPNETPATPSFLPRWMIRYLLLLSILWQLVCIGILSFVDFKTHKTSSHHTAKVVSNVILTAFTSVHLLVVILITMRVAAKVAAHTATFSFLIQSYLSTVLLFSGLYTLCTRFQVNHRHLVTNMYMHVCVCVPTVSFIPTHCRERRRQLL